MKSIIEDPKQVSIHDENGDLLTVGDNDRRYFEAPWMHDLKENIIFHTQQEILIKLLMQLVIVHMAHSLIKV